MQNQACKTKSSPVQSRVGGWVGGHCRQKKKKRLDPLHNTLNSLSKGGGGGRKVILFLPWTQPQITISKAETGTEKKSYSILVSSTEMITIFVSKTNREQKRFSVFPPQVQSGKSCFKGGWRRRRKKGKRKMIHTAASHNSGFKKKKKKREQKSNSVLGVSTEMNPISHSRRQRSTITMQTMALTSLIKIKRVVWTTHSALVNSPLLRRIIILIWGSS